ncbi:hypothetical protein TcasGA2_TC032128 [Tribolium castaneum]|uniref:Uncharacterized protein n=1 Tax=Tribolium castaneum TaxID=7070 RepID=A0A139WMS7_TRICA|nr:hypothetical protein TcasGA2_TC032128 [Tribolium castaneum]
MINISLVKPPDLRPNGQKMLRESSRKFNQFFKKSNALTR